MDFWTKKHHKYAKADWISKPSIFAQEIIKYFPRSGRILELGAGHGQDSRFFSEKGYEVVLTDFSDTALEYAKNKTNSENIKIHKLDLLESNFPYANNSFNVVYAHLSLHYFSNKETQKIFDEIHRVLKQDGIFAILLNSANDPEINKFKKISRGYYLDTKSNIKKRFFNTKTLSIFVQKIFTPILFDEKGKTNKDSHFGLVRFVGKNK